MPLYFYLQQSPPVLTRLILPIGLLIGLFLILQRRVRGGYYHEHAPKNIKDVDLTTPETSDRIPLRGHLPELYVFLDFKTFEPRLANFFAAQLVRWQEAGLIETIDADTLNVVGELETDDPFAAKFWQFLVTTQGDRDELSVDHFHETLDMSSLVTQRVFGDFAAMGLDAGIEDGLVTVSDGALGKKVYLTDTGKEELQNLYAFERYLDTAELATIPLDILTAFDRVPDEVRETPAWQAAFNFGFTAHAVHLAFLYRARMRQGGG